MEYLVDRLLCVNDIHILGGSPGAGKSTLLTWILKTLLHENELFNHQITNRPSFCGILVTDRRVEHEVEMLKKVGIEKEVAVNSLVDGEMSTDLLETGTARSHIKLLESLLDELGKSKIGEPPPPGSLLIVDPFSMFTGSNPNAYMLVALRMMNIQRMACKRKWTIIGVLHGSKQRAGKDERYIRAQDRILGSTAYTGSATTSMFLIDKEESGHGQPEFYMNPRNGERIVVKMKFTENGLMIPDDTPPPGIEQVMCDEDNALIINAVPEEGIQKGALKVQMELAGITKSPFYRRLNKLKELGILAEDSGEIIFRVVEDAEA